MTGGWASYSWPPAIVLVAVMVIFLMDLGAERYVEEKYGHQHDHDSLEGMVTGQAHSCPRPSKIADLPSALLQTGDIEAARSDMHSHNHPSPTKEMTEETWDDSQSSTKMILAEENAFRTQFAAFLILEFGVIVHSVSGYPPCKHPKILTQLNQIVIGLNLGVVGAEFTTLYPVLVFHQSFEGLGIGARMSAIPFPQRYRNWLPWLLCTIYGLTTPIAIAVGLGVRTTYNPNSFTANIVSGVLDSVSAGILIYTGLVELLARDFLFDPMRTRDSWRLGFMVICVLLGAGVMALLGKWA